MTDYSKITALYSRLSVGDEDRDGGESNSIQNQKRILETYAKQNGFTNLCWYTDDGYSGANFQRPGFQAMLADIEAGKVGTVIVKDMNVSMTRTKYATSALIFIIALSARLTCPKNKPDLSDTLRKCRIGTAKFFTLLLLLYHT